MRTGATLGLGLASFIAEAGHARAGAVADHDLVHGARHLLRHMPHHYNNAFCRGLFTHNRRIAAQADQEQS